MKTTAPLTLRTIKHFPLCHQRSQRTLSGLVGRLHRPCCLRHRAVSTCGCADIWLSGLVHHSLYRPWRPPLPTARSVHFGTRPAVPKAWMLKSRQRDNAYAAQKGRNIEECLSQRAGRLTPFGAALKITACAQQMAPIVSIPVVL